LDEIAQAVLVVDVCDLRVLELVSTPPAAALGRGASRARREKRGALEDEYASGEQRCAATQIGPSPSADKGLRRHAALSGVSPPRRNAATTPSSSFLGAGGMAHATRLARGAEANSDVRQR